MTNHMAEVAKILGLELDEVFFFKGCSGCYTYCIAQRHILNLREMG